MASITQRGKRFTVRVRRDGFPSITKTFTKRADGAAWGRQVEADIESGRWTPEAEQVPTLRKVISTYRVAVAAKMKGAATYTYRFDEFERLPFASKAVNEVTPFDLSAWRDEQLSQHKPATVVRKLAMLSAVFNWAAKERGWLQKNPVSLVAKPRVSDQRSRVLSDDEHRYLTAAAATSKATWLPAALTVLMASAMRRGELFGLRRRDVDFGAAVAHLADTKNGSARDVPLCPATLQALQRLADAAPARPDSLLLPVGEAGSVSTRFTVTIRRARASYESDCAAASVDADPGFLADVRLHDLRHQAVTMWASTGGLSLPELMAVSGHKTPRMLMRYTHLSASKIAGKLAQLSAPAAAQLQGVGA